MKRISLLFIAIALILTSCKTVPPKDCTKEEITPKEKQFIQCENKSHNVQKVRIGNMNYYVIRQNSSRLSVVNYTLDSLKKIEIERVLRK